MLLDMLAIQAAIVLPVQLQNFHVQRARLTFYLPRAIALLVLRDFCVVKLGHLLIY